MESDEHYITPEMLAYLKKTHSAIRQLQSAIDRELPEDEPEETEEDEFHRLIAYLKKMEVKKE